MLKFVEVKDNIMDYFGLIHKWHTDPAISQKIGCTHEPSIEDTGRLLLSWKRDSARLIFMIYRGKTEIGYVSLSGINTEHHFCDLHTLVGDHACLGKPVCVSVIDGILDIAFNKMGMERVNTYVLGDNPVLKKTSIKYGWTEEGLMRGLFINRDGQRVDCHIFGMLKKEFKPRRIKCQ
jgi:RimJ/RimL family protein N-acetyltransferase